MYFYKLNVQNYREFVCDKIQDPFDFLKMNATLSGKTRNAGVAQWQCISFPS